MTAEPDRTRTGPGLFFSSEGLFMTSYGINRVGHRVALTFS
jgi:hypothetical protein